MNNYTPSADQAETSTFYAVAAISRKDNKEFPPRFDLAPMNHAAACNFMDACRDRYTDYRLLPWPEGVPFTKPPMLAKGYRESK